jgi:hypothetical protein
VSIRSIRIPDQLDLLAQWHADCLGVSVNALVCIAVDAYVRSRPMPEPLDPPPASQSALGPGHARKPADKGGKK